MTDEIYCSVASIASSFDGPFPASLDVEVLSGDEGRKLERRYRSRRAAVVVHAFERLIARIDEQLPAPERRGIVLGTATGSGPDIEAFLDESIRAGDHLANPGLFPMTVHNAAAGIAAIVAGCRGPNVVVSAGASSCRAALDPACDLIRDGSADLIFVGGFESQSVEQDSRGTVAAVVALAASPQALGSSCLGPLAAVAGPSGRSSPRDGLVDAPGPVTSIVQANVEALLGWAEFFTPAASPSLVGSSDSTAKVIV